MDTRKVKVGEELLTLENFHEGYSLVDSVSAAIQNLSKSLDQLVGGTGEITLKLTLEKTPGIAEYEVGSKLSASLKASSTGDKITRVVKTGEVDGQSGLIVEKFEQIPLPLMSAIEGGRR